MPLSYYSTQKTPRKLGGICKVKNNSKIIKEIIKTDKDGNIRTIKGVRIA